MGMTKNANIRWTFSIGAKKNYVPVRYKMAERDADPT